MSEQTLTNLEVQVDALVDCHEKNQSYSQKIEVENQSLRQKLVKLTQRCAILTEKSRKTSIQIKKLIQQLKEDTQ